MAVRTLPRLSAPSALLIALLAWTVVAIGLFALLRVTGLDRAEDHVLSD